MNAEDLGVRVLKSINFASCFWDKKREREREREMGNFSSCLLLVGG